MYTFVNILLVMKSEMEFYVNFYWLKCSVKSFGDHVSLKGRYLCNAITTVYTVELSGD